jgi:iron complex outermembrane receptor protein
LDVFPAAEPVTQLISLTATNADFSLKKGQQYEAGLKGTFFRSKLDATLAIFNLLKKDLLTSTTDPLTGIRTSFEKIVLVPRNRPRSLPPLP